MNKGYKPILSDRQSLNEISLPSKARERLQQGSVRRLFNIAEILQSEFLEILVERCKIVEAVVFKGFSNMISPSQNKLGEGRSQRKLLKHIDMKYVMNVTLERELLQSVQWGLKG